MPEALGTASPAPDAFFTVVLAFGSGAWSSGPSERSEHNREKRRKLGEAADELAGKFVGG